MQQDNKDGVQKKEVSIDAFDFFTVLLKYKKLILAMVIGAGLLSALYGLFLKKDHTPPPVLMYRSECALLINSNSNVDYMIANIKSKLILKGVFVKCQQMGKDFGNMTYETFGKMMKFDVDSASKILNIAVESKDPQSSQNALTCFVSQFNDVLKANALEPLESKRSYFRTKYKLSTDAYEKQSLAERLVHVDEQIFTIKSMKYYNYETIRSTQVQSQGQGTKPLNPILLTLFMMFLALMVAVTIAFLLEYFQNLKTSEPQKLRAMKKLLRFRDRDK